AYRPATMSQTSLSKTLEDNGWGVDSMTAAMRGHHGGGGAAFQEPALWQPAPATEQEPDDREDQRHDENDLGEPRRRCGDASEAQDAGDDGNDQKNDSRLEHRIAS